MKKTFAAAVALSAIIILPACSNDSERVPIDLRDRLSEEHQGTYEEMQDVLECYEGYRGTESITDDQTITSPAGVDEKPNATDQAAWDYWQEKLEQKRLISGLNYSRSSIEPTLMSDRKLLEHFSQYSQDQSIAFYVVGTADRSYDEKALANGTNARYVNLKTTLLRVNLILAAMENAGIHPNRICRVPKGILGYRDERAVKVYAFDSGINADLTSE